MEFDDNRSRGRFVLVVGLILAVVAGGAAFFLISQAQQQAIRSSPTAAIVVATRQIPARKPIEASDIALREVPIDPTNAEGVFADPTKVIGLVPGVNFLASQAQGGQFSILEPGETIAPDSEAWRAVSLTVPDDRAVGGLVRAGDTVDVFVTVTVTVPDDLALAGTYYTDKATKITYQDLVVLAKSSTFYVMKVPAALAEEISHLQASGAAAFSLALRPPNDTRPVDASRLGETTNLIIQHYGLPIPRAFPPGSGPLPTPKPTPKPTPAPSAGASAAP
jgi:pilus assembly protein CpaB